MSGGMSTRTLAIIAVLGAIIVGVLVVKGFSGADVPPPAAVAPPSR
jgi:hypothetical protein